MPTPGPRFGGISRGIRLFPTTPLRIASIPRPSSRMVFCITEMALYAMPVVAENVLYLQGQDGHVTTLDALTGVEFWQTQLGWGGAPVVAESTLYASGYGNLFALGNAGDTNALTLA